MLAMDGSWRDADSGTDVLRALARPVTLASLALMLGLGAFLLGRRLGGAMSEPLAPVPLVATAAALTLWATVLRLRLRSGPLAWLPLATLALFAVACSYPGGRSYDWAVWLAALAIYWFAPARRSSPATGTELGAHAVVTQRMARSRSGEGEAIYGTLLAEFAAGERTVTLHVAFCPPFEQLPHVDAEAVDGEVRVVQVLHQGARLEVRRWSDDLAPAPVPVEFAATCRSPLAV